MTIGCAAGRASLGAMAWMLGASLAATLGACAFDVIHVEQTATRLESTGARDQPFELLADVDVDIGYGYQRILRKGTKWRPVGRIPQGDVYTTSNIQEAYIVVESRRLVGFYLPVERTFSPVKQRVELAMKEVS
jgi:hypothetical protein